MQLDPEALYSLVIQEAALRTASVTPGRHVVDAFCGAGGSAIGFARAGKRVTAIELNPARLEMARYNARLFGVDSQIEFLQGDALELWPTVKADSVFLSPPWGGPSYSTIDAFRLEHFTPHGVLLLEAAAQLKTDVVMQLPKNFDRRELDGRGWKVTVSEDVVEGHLLSYTAVMEWEA